MSDIDIETVARKVNEIIETQKLDIEKLCYHEGERTYPQYGGGGIYCKDCGDTVGWEEVYDD